MWFLGRLVFHKPPIFKFVPKFRLRKDFLFISENPTIVLLLTRLIQRAVRGLEFQFQGEAREIDGLPAGRVS
jgi:hypothetical protein